MAPGVRSAMAVAVSCLVMGGLARAQAPEQALEPVVVTATRVPTPLSHVLSDVTVIDREEIERQGAGGLVDALRRVPGAEFTRTGGPGGTTGFFLRGAENRHTAVLIDGVRVDSQSTGGPPWEGIPLSQIDRIEIVRGPVSTVYGSDAIGGVVQIFTRRARQGTQADLQVGAGSQRFTRMQGSVGMGGPLVDGLLSFVTEYSHGFDATTAKAGASHVPDADGYQTHTLNGRLGLQLNRAHRVEWTGLRSRWDSQYDSSFPAKADHHSQRALDTHSLNWQAQWAQPWRSQLTLAESNERYETRPSPYQTSTRVTTAAWQHDVVLGAHAFNAVLERRVDNLLNTSLVSSPTKGEGRRRFDSFGLGYGLNTDSYSLQLNARNDDDSEFGMHHTGSVAAGWRFAKGWQVRVAVGEAFRVPTLYQRFSEYGQAALLPESSLNREMGLDWRQGGTVFGATLYRNEVENLITFSTPGVCVNKFNCYRNTAQALLKGLTLHGEITLWTVRWSASLDLQSPKDVKTDKLLMRRSRQHASLRADTAVGAWSLGAEVLASGKRYNDAANKLAMGGYALLNLDAQYRVDKAWSVLARLDNVLDKDYQTALNYNSAPASVFVGLRWTMDR